MQDHVFSTSNIHINQKRHHKTPPADDPDRSQNLMGSKLDQDPSSYFFMKTQRSVIHNINQTG